MLSAICGPLLNSCLAEGYTYDGFSFKLSPLHHSMWAPRPPAPRPPRLGLPEPSQEQSEPTFPMAQRSLFQQDDVAPKIDVGETLI